MLYEVITGLLFSLPLLSKDSEIIITDSLESASYVQMTLDVLKLFGVHVVMKNGRIKIPGKQKFKTPGEVMVEGDWSNAAFWLCAGAIGTDPLSCGGLDPSYNFV